MTNNEARKEVKLLKVNNDITYLEFAEILGITASSMYCWINGQYDLGKERLAAAASLIADLKGE